MGGKELFYHKGCKFAFVGVDQTLRRPLAVLLSEIAVEDKAASKTSGQFRKAKLRRGRGSTAVILSSVGRPPALLRVTKNEGVVFFVFFRSTAVLYAVSFCDRGFKTCPDLVTSATPSFSPTPLRPRGRGQVENPPQTANAASSPFRKGGAWIASAGIMTVYN